MEWTAKPIIPSKRAPSGRAAPPWDKRPLQVMSSQGAWLEFVKWNGFLKSSLTCPGIHVPWVTPKLPGPCLTEEGWVSGCVSNLESWAVWLARSYSALLCAEGNRAAVQNWSFRPLKSHATGRGVLTQTQSCRHLALLRFPFQIRFLFMLLRLLRENNIQVTCLVISMQAISF